jgi:hypothetical protein
MVIGDDEMGTGSGRHSALLRLSWQSACDLSAAICLASDRLVQAPNPIMFESS